MQTDTQPTCEDRIDTSLARRLEDLNRMLNSDDEDEREELYDYALSFDYVEPDTFDDQPIGYWRYQLSWGGPSDEFRIFHNGLRVWKVTYHFQDWFDGAFRDVTDNTVVRQLVDWLDPWMENQPEPHKYV